MSEELKTYDFPVDHGDFTTTVELFYLKSEADKVIAELKDKLRHYPIMVALINAGNKEIAELKADYKEACGRLQTANLIKAEQLAATRHQKYKRCLAMASLSLEKRETYRAEYEEWCLKWYKRWLELAEKFREAK